MVLYTSPFNLFSFFMRYATSTEKQKKNKARQGKATTADKKSTESKS